MIPNLFESKPMTAHEFEFDPVPTPGPIPTPHRQQVIEPPREVPNLSGSALRADINHDISPLELSIAISQKIMAAAMYEMQLSGGQMTPEALLMFRQASQTNATVLPYTHAKLSAADINTKSDDTTSMLDDINTRRVARQQEIARQYDNDILKVTNL